MADTANPIEQTIVDTPATATVQVSIEWTETNIPKRLVTPSIMDSRAKMESIYAVEVYRTENGKPVNITAEGPSPKTDPVGFRAWMKSVLDEEEDAYATYKTARTGGSTLSRSHVKTGGVCEGDFVRYCFMRKNECLPASKNARLGVSKKNGIDNTLVAENPETGAKYTMYLHSDTLHVMVVMEAGSALHKSFATANKSEAELLAEGIDAIKANITEENSPAVNRAMETFITAMFTKR